MTAAATAIRDRLRTDLEKFETLGHLDPVTGREVDRVVDAYATEFDIEARCQVYGETYVVADLLFEFFAHRGVALSHPVAWAGGDDSLERLAAQASIDRETREAVESIAADRDRAAPDGYDDVLPAYLALADDCLEEPAWTVSGDRHSETPVSVAVRHAGTQFETELDASDEVDVAALLDLLNRVVSDTTADERRYAAIDTWQTADADVFFVHDAKTLENYFSFACESAGRHAERTTD